MPRKSIVVVDVIWEFRMSKQYQISIEAARGNLVPTNVSKNETDSTKSRCLLLLKRHLKICFWQKQSL